VRHLRRIALLTLGAASPAFAGPPYLTDDPAPTDTGHWEIYAFGSGEGRKLDVDVDTGFDLNYGAIKGMQLTATLPLSFSHSREEGWRGGSGDVEVAVKYRFLDDEESGFSAAVFPRVILPTAAHSPGERARYLLPLWVQKEFAGGTTIFGGGGYTINPGAVNRDFWQAAVALTKDVNNAVSLGAEIAHEGADIRGATSHTRAGMGAVFKLSERYSLLFSGGPAWADHRTGYHAYAALGLNL